MSHCVLDTILCSKLLYCTSPVGFNGDCAVNFVNGVDQAQTFQNIVFIEWEEVGSVRATDCRLDDGTFILCEFESQRLYVSDCVHVYSWV